MSTTIQNQNMFASLAESNEFPTLADAAKVSDKEVAKTLSKKYKRRTKAFEQMVDLSTMQKSLYRTKLCNSVTGDQPRKCSYGHRCRFAHTVDELTVSECFFGEDCDYVIYSREKGRFFNKKGKTCMHQHPEETREDYFDRCGIELPKVQPLPAAEEPKPLGWKNELPSSPNKPRRKIDLDPQRLVKPTPVPPSPSTMLELEPQVASVGTETILRVPAELAVKAMELAMSSGKTNIRVEII